MAILRMSSSNFAQVTSVLPNRKITAPDDAADPITFSDSNETHANGKISGHFLNLCRRMLHQVGVGNALKTTGDNARCVAPVRFLLRQQTKPYG
jgi:hypothetical protein